MVPAQRVKIPKGGAHHRVSKGHGTHGHSWSQYPSVLHRLHLLSLVWERGAEWGDCGQPLEDNPLQARPCVRLVFWLPNWCRTHSIGMGAKIVIGTVSLLDWVCPTDLPAQPRVHSRKWRQCYSTRPPFLQKTRRFNEEGATCQPTKSIFYSPASLTRQLFSFQLWPELLKNDATNNVKHTHPNWLQLRQCSQELVKTTTPNS